MILTLNLSKERLWCLMVGHKRPGWTTRFWQPYCYCVRCDNYLKNPIKRSEWIKQRGAKQ